MLRIIYVDDDHDECFLFAEALQRLSIKHKLYTANKCSDLVKLLKEKDDIDIIFLDMNMPITDGKECLKEVKSNHQWRGIPVIVLTGSYNKYDIDEVYSLGAHLYIIKPFIHTEFVRMLNVLLTSHWLKSPTPSFNKFVIKETDQLNS
jgi:CheY-like chemotaxis protein